MEFKDKTAKIISNALNMFKDDEIKKYAMVMSYIKNLEQEFFNGQSPLNADTIYELYKNYCDEYMVDNFCARVYYHKKFSEFKIYDEEPLNRGKKRILELYKIIKDNDKRAKVEYSKLCEDPEYQGFLTQRYNYSIKQDNHEIKLIDYALGKKEAKFNKYLDAQNTVKDYICEVMTGMTKEEISIELRKNIVSNFENDANKLYDAMTM